MRHSFKFLALFFFLNILMACHPQSKEKYIQRYDEFIENVSNSYNTFSESDWEKQVQKLELYSKQYYEKFQNELTTSEKIKLSMYPIKFYYYMGLVDIKQGYQQLQEDWDEEIDIIKTEIKDLEKYIKEDLLMEIDSLEIDIQGVVSDIDSLFESLR